MTQEDKQLLIKDLCARLPYSVCGLHRGEDFPLYVIDNSGAYMVLGYHAWFDLETVPFKPYLRPMSSMTEEEKSGLQNKFCYGWDYKDESIWDFVDHHKIYVADAELLINWFNEHHFDYRGLIPMNLALEAPEGMYKTE